MQNFSELIDRILWESFQKDAKSASVKELYHAISGAATQIASGRWQNCRVGINKRACYLSAEFLMGRLFYSNLLNLDLLEECKNYLKERGLDITRFEDVEDDALGNGGLGRLAACFLDSAATHNLPLDGYGIRYRYGLFKQTFSNGFQQESPDDWMCWGDPWSIRREEESILVRYGDMDVVAVPYDMPVIGYKNNTVNNLRLWQAEAPGSFDFPAFNRQEYDDAEKKRNRAEAISAVLYPNDDTLEGKRLRLRQQYFFSSASMQSMVNRLLHNGGNVREFANHFAVQLNDTHPVVAIPELLRILMDQHDLSFAEALPIVQKTFSYTNHTVMPEALEKWDVTLFASLLPEVYPYVVLLQNTLYRELMEKGITGENRAPYAIRKNGRVEMANLAVFATQSTNGVARIHTEILKDRVLHQWHTLYPDRINNKTNGITQRRWLALCNPELASFIKDRIGDGFLTDLTQLEALKKYADDGNSIQQFLEIKEHNKRRLAAEIKKREGVDIEPTFLFDIQIKRLHEYKRQLLSALGILDTYFGIKDGRIQNMTPTAWIFGAKSAPGYKRAKGIIKLINEIGRIVNSDPDVNGKMRVVFVQNYNVSYAELLVPAADVSEQISTAGTEASGTGNMKLMLNGAVTLGTLDGANIEIVQEAGEENNYIFGATVPQIVEAEASYDPMAIYRSDARIAKVLDALVDETFLYDGGTGMFSELRESILRGASWHRPDQYFLLLDFHSYCDARQRLQTEYQDRMAFGKKMLLNTASAGKFSSDRTIQEYAKEIWGV